MSDLSEIVAELNKRFGRNTIISGDSLVGLDVDRVSTGSLSIDIETGGGLPYGRIVEFYGRESTGKTAIALKTTAEVQKQGKNVVWLDVEGSFDSEWAKLLGVNIPTLTVAKPESGEAAGDILEAVVKSGDCGLVVLDSVAALVPAKDVDTSMEDVEPLGNKAKMVNRIIRKLHSSLNTKVGDGNQPNTCLVIFINQIREKIGVMWGSPDTTPGGLGLKHAAAIRIEFRKRWLKDPDNTDHILGQTITFVTAKNKTYPPYRRGEFDFYTDGKVKGQIDFAREVLRYGILSGLIEHSGKSYTVGNKKYVGKENAVGALTNNSELTNKLAKQVLSRLTKKESDSVKAKKESKNDK